MPTDIAEQALCNLARPAITDGIMEPVDECLLKKVPIMRMLMIAKVKQNSDGAFALIIFQHQ